MGAVVGHAGVARAVRAGRVTQGARMTSVATFVAASGRQPTERMTARQLPGSVPASIVAFAPRDRSRRLVRASFPRRRGRVVVARTAAEFERALHGELVDAALVDVAAGDEAWDAAGRARELPTVPFFAIVPVRPSETPVLARCAELEFVDLLADGVDDAVLGALVEPHRFTVRFATALREPPPSFRLTSPLQREIWQCVIARAGRPTTTSEIAAQFSVTREHLSRSFTAAGGPTLKRVIDLVRLFVAAELAKNPGYDVGDVARILGFASSSHLASTTQRLVGTRPTSLARLRTVDLLERFESGAAGHTEPPA